MKLSLRAPTWGRLTAIALVLVSATAFAKQPKKHGGGAPKTPPAKTPPKDTTAPPKDRDAAPDTAKPADAPTPDAPGGGDKEPSVKAKESGSKKEKNFDFNALDLNGRMRTPQLLYFLERANEELERASLEKRSFIPHMVRSVEEEPL